MSSLVAALGFTDLLVRLRDEASGRDSTGALPFESVRELKAAGIGALRIPESRGGAGISLTELFEFVHELAAADPNVAHALRNHYVFVEEHLHAPAGSVGSTWIDRIAGGATVGGSFTELNAAKAGSFEFQTTLAHNGTHFLLNGDKFYSTGNIYADHLFVNAVREDGSPVTVALPATRPGIDLTDDWDGIGQRLTGSGSTLYRDVVVEESDIVGKDDAGWNEDTYSATFPQLYLTTVVAGIVSNMHDDAISMVRTRARNYYHGQTDEPRHESAVQQTIGQISTNDYAARSVVAAAAASLSAAAAAVPADRGATALAAALDAARAKVFVDDIAGRTGWLLFEAGSASSARQKANLDRHWRNARTISSHNPGSYKLRYLGDYELNDEHPPVGSFF